MNLTFEDIKNDFLALESWPDKYEYIIDLGLEVKDFDEEFRVNENLIKGCSSKVWLGYKTENKALKFYVDSDSMMVKGLLFILLSIFNQKSAKEILNINYSAFLEELSLKNHLTANRVSGLEATIEKIKLIANQEL
jgi:cysteine desulfuration protein SufE